ncbi:GNAT family N-acetyltransferase [Herbiconiux sp. UC225_62]|uniref:GNAT family N-acetyltransferase n=1 Tax=Herbiconiux sp. UC225_62 TaxID=3350168 RepID=UPI0036D32F15
MAREFSHDADQHRYTLRVDGAMASAVDYVVNENTISFTHTFTDPKKRGQGLAGEIVTYAVDDVEATTSYRVVPMCWYVGRWFDRHPERADLLTR